MVSSCTIAILTFKQRVEGFHWTRSERVGRRPGVQGYLAYKELPPPLLNGRIRDIYYTS